MRKKLMILLPFLLSVQFMLSQTSLAGKMTEAETGEPILFGNVALYKNGNLYTGVETDFDGNYKISNIAPGTYDVEASYIGFATKRIKGVEVIAYQENRLDIELVLKSITLEEIVVVEYKIPVIEKCVSYSVSTSNEQIRNLPSKNINALAANVRGLASADDGQEVTVRGSRSNAINYYIDGIGVQGTLVPESNRKARRQQRKNARKANKIAPTSPIVNKVEPTDFNRENYAFIEENRFQAALETPLSTFSIDVDAASYSNLRRFINNHQMPPADAVRIEEMINYFNYEYPQPKDEHPFKVITEISACPWQPDHQLLHIGLQGKKFDKSELPPSNLVFLIDVSGSMGDPNKLPLLQASFRLLTEELRPEDRVAIVVYAGSAGLVLPSTKGDEKEAILHAIDQLSSGGSTAGGAGIQLAYKIAKENFIEEGNNRVILATDGDFNVGVSSDGELVQMIEKKRESGVFLTVLGFGMGNYQDHKMQELANKGNGQHAYIDNIKEAKKVLVEEFGGTLLTIAKDVKLQLEFNPAKVQGYRLIGYENRMLNKEDFNDDKKDAGELGSGHTVTALYEIIPAGIETDWLASVDDLKYQKTEKLTASAKKTDEWLTVKLRYKQPDDDQSRLINLPILTQPKTLEQSSDNFRFAAAVAEFGLLLRDSEFKQNATYQQAKNLAQQAKGEDAKGYRKEFIQLIKQVEQIDKTLIAEKDD